MFDIMNGRGWGGGGLTEMILELPSPERPAHLPLKHANLAHGEGAGVLFPPGRVFALRQIVALSVVGKPVGTVGPPRERRNVTHRHETKAARPAHPFVAAKSCRSDRKYMVQVMGGRPYRAHTVGTYFARLQKLNHTELPRQR